MSLRERMLRGSKWTTLSVAVSMVTQALQFVVLARFLAPHELGAFAVVAVLTAYTEVFVGMGLTQALIQRRDITSDEVSSVFWLNLAVGAVLSLSLVAVAGPVAVLFDAPSVKGLVMISAISFFLTVLGQSPFAQINRELRFDLAARGEVIGFLAGFAVMTVLAVAGAGALAPVLGMVVLAGTRTASYWLGARRYMLPRWHFRFADTRRFLTFGALQFVDGVLNVTTNQLSTAVTGRMISTSAMGGYTLAYTASVNVPAKINPIITRIMFPAFATIQSDPARMNRGYLIVTRAVALASTPGLIGLAVVAPDAVTVLFGERWLWIVPIIRILAFVAIFRAVGNPIGPLITAADRLRLGLGVNVVKTSLLIPIVILGGAIGGATGIAGGLLVFSVLGFFFGYFILHRVLRTPFIPYVAASFGATIASVPMALAVWGTSSLMADLTSSALLRLVVSALVGVLVLLLSLVLLPGWPFTDVRRLVADVLGRPAGAAPPVVVLVAAEERMDGTGGAVATWVREIYRETDGVRVIAPVIGAEWGRDLDLVVPPGYGPLHKAALAVANRAGRLARRSPAALYHRLTGRGRLYLRMAIPLIQGARVVHVHNRPDYVPALRAAGYRGAVICHMHNDHLPANVERSPELADPGVVDLYLHCSDDLRRKGERVTPGIRHATIYNGVRRIAPQATPSTWSLAFAGRLTPEKGALEAIEVTRRLRDDVPATLDIYGGSDSGHSHGLTPYVRQLQAAADPGTSHPFVTLRGHLPHDELLEAIGRHRLLLNPVQWDEPFGMVVVESMAAGTPVVAFARGGIPEIIRDGVDGVLVAPDEGIEGMVAAVLALDDAAISHMSLAARERAATFEWSALRTEMDAHLAPYRGQHG